jgi:hypothetical protein
VKRDLRYRKFAPQCLGDLSLVGIESDSVAETTFQQGGNHEPRAAAYMDDFFAERSDGMRRSNSGIQLAAISFMVGVAPIVPVSIVSSVIDVLGHAETL